VAVINNSSKLVTVKHETPTDTTTLPVPNGTSSTSDITAFPLAKAKIRVKIGAGTGSPVEQTVTLGPVVTNVRDLRAQIENAIRAVPATATSPVAAPAAWTGATVELVGNKRLRVLAGKGGENYEPNDVIVISNDSPSDKTAMNILKFAAGAPDSNNAQQYALGSGSKAIGDVKTGADALSVTAAGYARTAGSFITDGFKQGMEVRASGFSNLANNGVSVVDTVSAQALKVNRATVAEPAGMGILEGFTDTLAALIRGIDGDDGQKPDATAIIGSSGPPAIGMHTLAEVDLFNILCIPRAVAADVEDSQRVAIYSAAESFCGQKRAFLLVDIPEDQDEVQEIKDWVDTHATLRDGNAAIYYPRTKVPDPRNEYRLRSIGTSGTMAGIYARTDSERGVWKAPAGVEAILRGVSDLDRKLTDAENGVLNPLGINCLRTFPVYGGIAWGARTLMGADQMANEWKYVPIRRLALMLEESLFRGTKWVVFEPNDEPLWAKIRLNVGAYMTSLFRQGAFQGVTPKQAFYVKCDGETTTEDDRNKGIVNIEVGFAPLKPAEFVVIKIQQMAGDL
jgi:hypothetical protein